jgi:hypothetical protein
MKDPEINPHSYHHLIVSKSAKKKTAYSTNGGGKTESGYPYVE